MNKIIKRLTVILLFVGVCLSAAAQQVDWKRFDRMIENGEYKSAFTQAQTIYDNSPSSNQRLAAAFWMAQAAAHYQEDASDSSFVRYTTLLPSLDTLEKALCYALLGNYDSALAYEQVLKRTPVSAIEQYCDGGKTRNVTPTAYDVVVMQYITLSGGLGRDGIALHRKLCAFHAGDNDDIRIWHDRFHIDLMEAVPNYPLTDDTVLRYIDKYHGTKSEYITLLYHSMAVRRYNARDYVGAVAWCDSALALSTKSEGGVDCANLRQNIMKVEFRAENDFLTVAPGQPNIGRVAYRNVEHLWFRIIPYDSQYDWGKDTDKRLRKAAPLEQWDMAVETKQKYVSDTSYFTLPSLKTGKYLLLVSPTADFKKHGFMAYEVNCTEMQLITYGNEGILLDSRSGRPITGQEVKLMKMEYYSNRADTAVLATTKTDRDGRFHFDLKAKWSTRLVVDRGGYRLMRNWYYNPSDKDNEWNQRVEVRMDRPIYKPGDTAHAAVVYFLTDGRDARAAEHFNVRYVLRDPNSKDVVEDSVRTDTYGVADFQFVLPKDRLPGNYMLSIYNYNTLRKVEHIRVEEYKQPKFMVTLGSDDAHETPQFDKPYTVKGMAASYSAVPVSGAKVKYTVIRSRLHRWWWHYGAFYQEEVDKGEATTAADGSFEITFTPLPDSNVELSTKPCFEYRISVDVTDINGESHPASTSVRVGYRNAFIALDGAEEVRTLDGLKPRYFDLNGNSLDGKVDMQIERLLQPATPLLNPPAMVKGAHHTMNYADFRKAFPLYAYSEDYNNRDTWLAVSDWKKDESGVYCITLTAPDADTVVAYRVLTASNARKVQSQQLLWCDIDKTTAEVGDTVTLRYGSRFKDVEVYYTLQSEDRERTFRSMRVSDELRTISLVVDSSMLGGIQFNIFAMREGVHVHKVYRVDVPYTHKKLDVEIATFRDKLQPGETEEWTIKVKGERLSAEPTPQQKEKESALVMTMYDDALNSYGSAKPWGFSPYRTYSGVPYDIYSIHNGTGWWTKGEDYINFNGEYPTVWRMKDGIPEGWFTGFGRKRNTRKYASEKGFVSTEVNIVEDKIPVIEIGAAESGARITSDDIQRMPASVNSVVAAVGGIGYSDAVKEEVEEMVLQTAEEAPAAPEPAPQLQMRSNLNTLAFFVAGLQTDSSGTATFRFTVPELLTRWNVKGLAITKDFKIGTLDKTLVTSKRLMVQPNMPRFLRSGDSLALMAKVIKSDESDKAEISDVVVTFLLTDAATGDTICRQRQHVQVKDAAQVMFDVEVPQNVYVATYEIMAVTEGMTDGERGQLPVVTNRQAVTISQAMYINGVREKHYKMPEFLVKSDTRQPRLVAVEVTSNPVWLAIKSMPYLKTQESPSTIYLANQYYVNTLGQTLLKNLKGLKDFSDLKGTPSRLNINEDVKQTLLQATPWVRDAESEEDQMAAVANYFNPDELNRTMEKSIKELQQRQNVDGGWSWMPDGKSSVWVTQQVLKMIDGERFNVDGALDYIDQEHQRDYEKYIKPNKLIGKLCGVTDIDYLYTRSFYGKAKTEAYRYYYSNALKSYRDYDNLYTQAQLALIFQRNGDHKTALDLLRRLKEKSLENDEMGMYWRDNKSGWFWYQRPIETQALIIQAFAEITPDDSLSIGQMQQWLLKQKQTTHWGNDQATTKAIAALMVGCTSNASQTGQASLTIFGAPMTADVKGKEGYQSQRWTDGALDSLIANHSSSITLRKESNGIAWGAVYYQFADDMDKIPSCEMGITLKRSYIADSPLHVGDRVKVHIEISCDRAMDYLELIDGRPSCMEPLSTRAGWRWSDGMGYYVTVNNTDTRCYVEHIDKGKYVFEYEVYVTNPGIFMAGAVTMQCMYAPEFRAVSPARRITVE